MLHNIGTTAAARPFGMPKLSSATAMKVLDYGQKTGLDLSSVLSNPAVQDGNVDQFLKMELTRRGADVSSLNPSNRRGNATINSYNSKLPPDVAAEQSFQSQLANLEDGPAKERSASGSKRRAADAYLNTLENGSTFEVLNAKFAKIRRWFGDSDVDTEASNDAKRQSEGLGPVINLLQEANEQRDKTIRPKPPRPTVQRDYERFKRRDAFVNALNREILNLAPENLKNELYVGLSDALVETLADPKFSGRQKLDQWCWAACVQMLCACHGIHYDQIDVVRVAKGGLRNEGGNLLDFFTALSVEGVQDNGQPIQLNAKVTDEAKDLLNDLKKNHPAILTLDMDEGKGHAVLLTGIRIFPTENGLPDFPKQFLSSETLGRSTNPGRNSQFVNSANILDMLSDSALQSGEVTRLPR